MGNLYCVTDLPGFDQDICDNSQSRVIGVAFMRNDHGITDYESAIQWNAAIAAGKVVVIKSVSGEEAAPTPKKIDGYGRSKSRTTSLDQSVNYEHNYNKGQEEFYNALNYASDRNFAYMTAAGLLFVVTDALVDVNAGRTTPKTLDDITKYMVAVEWTAQGQPLSYNAPASVFE